MSSRPLILISNDDGYHAKGINCLIEWVRDFGEVIVCAPERARSGFACAFSATTPLTLKQRRKQDGVEVWSCNGTPVDCVKMALAELCPRKPDLVIGGINHGDNASVNIHYSGTMGITLEGCMKYIPSVAFSLCDYRDDADFEPMRPYVCQMVQRVLTRCHHPRGYDYWWMVGTYTNDEPDAEDTDNWALNHGYIAITPTQIDVTAYEMLAKMKDWEQ